MSIEITVKETSLDVLQMLTEEKLQSSFNIVTA